jgi:hypothetical protein
MMVLPVLCYRLNKYLMYLAICAPTGAEVWASEVAHDRQALSPLGLLLIVDQEEHDRRVDDDG